MEKTQIHINREDQLKLYVNRELEIVDFTLDDADLETRCPLDNGRQGSPQSQQSVGRLDMLPLEIITSILITLDLPTLTTFRRINHRAMSLVDSIHQYNTILKHCPNILRAIISINANSFDCMTLYKVLSNRKCETCHYFGSYLYLITCKRVCYYCFTSKIEYLPVSIGHAAEYTSIPRKELFKHLPCILSLPGQYTAWPKLSKERLLFFDRQAVLNSATDTSIQYDLRIQQQDRITNETRRYVSIISAPYLGSWGQSADWGFYCIGCRDDTGPPLRFRVKFTKDEILDHFERYGAIKVVGGRLKHVG